MKENLELFSLQGAGVLLGLKELKEITTSAQGVTVTATTGAPLSRAQTLKELAKRLDAFATSHLDFFRDGFNETTNIHLKPSRVFPPEAVLGKIVAQMGEDAEIILRAANQRRNEELNKHLEIADKLAYRALSKAEKALGYKDFKTNQGEGEEYTALTYFQKSHEIRVIPYAPVALIGIPLSCLSQPRDFLAIPHEVGHYVYNHRRIRPNDDPMSHRFANPENRFAKWQEEVFADVCGALVGGSVMAFDFQELAQLYQHESFIDLTDDHPTPFLRPLIYSYVLRQRGSEDEATIADLLDARWAHKLVERWAQDLRIELDPKIKEARKQIVDRANAESKLSVVEHEHEQRVAAALDAAAFRGDRIALGAEIIALVDQALARLDQRDDWSGDLQLMLNQLKSRKDDLDHEFKTIIEGMADNAPESVDNTPQLADDALELAVDAPELAELSETGLEKLWENWVSHEEFFDKQTPQAIADGMPTPFIIEPVNDVLEFADEPANPTHENKDDYKYPWQPLWFAGGWSTGPNESPGRPP